MSAIVLAAVKDPRGHGHEASRERQNAHSVPKIHICPYDLRSRYDSIALRVVFLADNESRRNKTPQSQRIEDRPPNFVCMYRV